MGARLSDDRAILGVAENRADARLKGLSLIRDLPPPHFEWRLFELALGQLLLRLTLNPGHPNRIADGSLAGVHRRVVAGELARERRVVLERLKRSGVLCVDALPEEVSVELINRYLEVKRRRLV